MIKDKLKCSKYVEADDFSCLSYEVLLSSSGVEHVHFVSDIDYLLGIKSVEHLDPLMIQKIAVMNDKCPLPPNVTDEQLIAFCKPRYIQEPSDAERWYNVLTKFGEDYKDAKQDELDDYFDDHYDDVVTEQQSTESQSSSSE